MIKKLGKLLIKIALKLLPLNKSSHKSVEFMINEWVDELNKKYEKRYRKSNKRRKNS